MTSARPKRLVGELPGDPARLHLHYGHGHPAVPYDFEDTLESWYVKVTYGMAGDEEWEDEEGEGSRAPAAGTEVGHVILWRLRDDTGDSGWEAADAESGDLEVIAAAVLGRSGRAGYSAAFEKAVTHPVGDLLILDRVHLDRAWRGFGLGPILVAETIRRLSGGCCAVAAYPAMGEYPEDREQVTEASRRQAKKKIAASGWRLHLTMRASTRACSVEVVAPPRLVHEWSRPFPRWRHRHLGARTYKPSIQRRRHHRRADSPTPTIGHTIDS